MFIASTEENLVERIRVEFARKSPKELRAQRQGLELALSIPDLRAHEFIRENIMPAVEKVFQALENANPRVLSDTGTVDITTGFYVPDREERLLQEELGIKPVTIGLVLDRLMYERLIGTKAVNVGNCTSIYPFSFTGTYLEPFGTIVIAGERDMSSTEVYNRLFHIFAYQQMRNLKEMQFVKPDSDLTKRYHVGIRFLAEILGFFVKTYFDLRELDRDFIKKCQARGKDPVRVFVDSIDPEKLETLFTRYYLENYVKEYGEAIKPYYEELARKLPENMKLIAKFGLRGNFKKLCDVIGKAVYTPLEMAKEGRFYDPFADLEVLRKIYEEGRFNQLAKQENSG